MFNLPLLQWTQLKLSTTIAGILTWSGPASCSWGFSSVIPLVLQKPGIGTGYVPALLARADYFCMALLIPTLAPWTWLYQGLKLCHDVLRNVVWQVVGESRSAAFWPPTLSASTLCMHKWSVEMCVVWVLTRLTMPLGGWWMLGCLCHTVVCLRRWSSVLARCGSVRCVCAMCRYCFLCCEQCAVRWQRVKTWASYISRTRSVRWGRVLDRLAWAICLWLCWMRKRVTLRRHKRLYVVDEREEWMLSNAWIGYVEEDECLKVLLSEQDLFPLTGYIC